MTKCWAHCPERKEQAAEYRKLFYEKNREFELSYNKQYVKDNKERIKQQKKERYDNNAIEYNKISKQWRRNNVIRQVIHSCKGKDKKYNMFFNLTEEWVKKILDHQEWKCYHCDQYLLLENGNNDPDQLSIDRVNNSKGHFKGNVVLSCWHCNFTRRNKDINTFTPDPKYTILKDNEESDSESDWHEPKMAGPTG